MPDIFTPVIQKLGEIGAFKFLFPYLLTSAIFYGLLRKSQVFGKPEENVAVNAVVALVASFMVWAYPVLGGVDIQTQLSAFFTQGIVITLAFMIGLMIIGMFFPPDLSKYLADNLFKGNKAWSIVIIGLAFAFFILGTSGLWSALVNPQAFAGVPSDVLMTIAVIVLLVLPIIFITYEKPAPKVEKGEEK